MYVIALFLLSLTASEPVPQYTVYCPDARVQADTDQELRLEALELRVAQQQEDLHYLVDQLRR